MASPRGMRWKEGCVVWSQLSARRFRASVRSAPDFERTTATACRLSDGDGVVPAAPMMAFSASVSDIEEHRLLAAVVLVQPPNGLVNELPVNLQATGPATESPRHDLGRRAPGEGVNDNAIGRRASGDEELRQPFGHGGGVGHA